MSRNLEALELWRGALVASVRAASPDLSARQLALLLTVYMTPPPHTVRGLAATLNVSKPAITRALDRLGRLGFTKRKRDAEDRRNVLVQRTVKGSVFLHEFGQMVIDAGAVQGALDGSRVAAPRPAATPVAPPSASEPVSAPV
ncbi:MULTISPECIES: MarR family transcriptional regulator [Nitrospirillum]|uniref:MarR family protein n=1 Tax=Nitrospirillum amazonense TaxID=28077 RepID=A0A560FQS9_9PROT|nr:MarR family transcriptional regulator [Nitrospirillum amazonense]MEC4594592.1 MarR family transcriptional regulator [Nitrospirillum amazonense]TWB23977.1 MarR family protein [Nitrospirillum amazonense]